MFITHDFGVVAEIADRIAVMESGKLVEINYAKNLLTSPQHPYTKKLLGAVPSILPAKSRALSVIKSDSTRSQKFIKSF